MGKYRASLRLEKNSEKNPIRDCNHNSLKSYKMKSERYMSKQKNDMFDW